MKRKCQRGTWFFSFLHFPVPARGADRHRPDNPVHVCLPRYSAKTFFHEVTRVLPWMKAGWGLPAHVLQPSNSCAYLCLTPTMQLGTPHLCANVQLHPQLLLSAHRLSIMATQLCSSSCVQCRSIHGNLPNPKRSQEGCTEVEGARQKQHHLCSNFHRASSPASSSKVPFPWSQCSVLTQTCWSKFCSLVKVNQNIKVLLKKCHILNVFYLLAFELSVV